MMNGPRSILSFRTPASSGAASGPHGCRNTCAAFVALALAMPMAGCQNTTVSDMTASITAPSQQPPESNQGALHAYADELGRRFDSHPDDKAVGMAYARALKGLTQYAQAVAVLQRVAVKHAHDLDVLAAYGKALADAGRLQEATDVLARSHTPERPNWTVLSAQGSVADQLGNHEQAQGYYNAALKIAPDQPQVLSNLGLSYALQRQMPAAEQALRTAVAQPGADMRVRQNLSLVLAMEGKYAEAEEIARRDLAPIDAAANVASVRQMIAHSDTWKQPRSSADRKAIASQPQTARTQTAATDEAQ